MRRHLNALGAALAVALLATPVYAQAQVPSNPARNDLSIRGKITRIEAPDNFVVRTQDNKEVTFYANPQTRYVINGKGATYRDLTVGTEVNAVYTRQADRFNVTTVTVGTAPAGETIRVSPAQPAPAVSKTTLRGKIVRLQGQDQFVVRTANDKEVILFTNPQSRYLINGRPGRFTDLRVGAELNVDYVIQDDRHWVQTVTIGETVVAPAPAPAVTPVPAVQDTRVEGTIVRVADGQVVIKTGENKEVIIHVDPQTRYTFEERQVRFNDLRTGSPVRVEYELRDRRPVARSILGIRRN
jgi:hypothetical protein